uniref:Uncharacterized protein n=1 Tax=Anguilla anguilla TaxID=7936 RepID=A0A0E9WWX6_ANGAN
MFKKKRKYPLMVKCSMKHTQAIPTKEGLQRLHQQQYLRNRHLRNLECLHH